MNELRAMQQLIARKNREAGMPLGDVTDLTDDEGFAPPAPAPPAEAQREDVVALAPSNPKAALEQYQFSKYPPKISSVDLDAMAVTGSHGRFPLNEEEVKAVTAICVQAIKRSFESILQTLIDQAGLSVSEQGSDTTGLENGGDAQETPSQVASVAPIITKKVKNTR